MGIRLAVMPATRLLTVGARDGYAPPPHEQHACVASSPLALFAYADSLPQLASHAGPCRSAVFRLQYLFCSMIRHVPSVLDFHPGTSPHPGGHCGHEQLQCAYSRICQQSPLAWICAQSSFVFLSIAASSSVQLIVGASEGTAVGALEGRAVEGALVEGTAVGTEGAVVGTSTRV